MRDVAAELLDPTQRRSRASEHRACWLRRTPCGRSSGTSDVPHVMALGNRRDGWPCPRWRAERERTAAICCPNSSSPPGRRSPKSVEPDVGEAVLDLVGGPGPLAERARGARQHAHPRRPARRELGFAGGRHGADRLGTRGPGPSGGGTRLVHVPLQSGASRRATTRWSRTSATHCGDADDPEALDVRPALGARAVRLDPRHSPRASTPTPPSEPGRARSLTGGCRACGTRSITGGDCGGLDGQETRGDPRRAG